MQGPQGFQGAQGDAGVQGPQGFQGTAGAQGETGNGLTGAYIQGPVPTIADTPTDVGCNIGDIAVGTGYQLANAGVLATQIQPLTTSGYQFTFTGGGASIWVSCLAATTPLARMARIGESDRAGAAKVEKPAGKSARAVTAEAGKPDSKPDRAVTAKAGKPGSKPDRAVTAEVEKPDRAVTAKAGKPGSKPARPGTAKEDK